MGLDELRRSSGSFSHEHWAIRQGGNDGGLNTLTVRLSTGSTFTPQHWAIRQGTWMNSTHWLTGDFDGNGATDVVGVRNDGGQTSFAVFRSNGASFLPHSQWAIRAGGWANNTQ